MSRFNVPQSTRPLHPSLKPNLAGGVGYKLSPEMELLSITLTSFTTDKYYETWNGQQSRITGLVDECGPVFTAKCAYYARRVHNLRSISHVLASLVKDRQRFEPYDYRQFYYSITPRPDDITEILSLTNKKMTHAMKKAFAERMVGYDEYQLAKYARTQRKRKVYLTDVQNLCHPPHTIALEKLHLGTLTNTDTWEARGNTLETWLSLLSENRLGYLALLRNLRNIEAYNNRSLDTLALNTLTSPGNISKSRVFPFQFYRAYKAVSTGAYKNAISAACDISMSNLPPLLGNTVILLDQSGSMQAHRETASMFAAALYHKHDARIISFDYTAKEIRTKSQSIISTAMDLDSRYRGGGTDFSAAYNYLRDHQIPCSRLFIITDMQHWVGNDSSYGSFLEWSSLTDSDPETWSIDLAGYGTSQFPSNKCRQLFGFSEKLFDVIHELEDNPSALLDRVKNLEIS